MAYADATFYSGTYKGREAATEEVEKWLARASNDIDVRTRFVIDVAALTDVQANILKMATCAQAEDYIANGEWIDSFDSMSLGSFSISGGEKRQDMILCSRAEMYLSTGGFLFGGVPCARYHG